MKNRIIRESEVTKITGMSRATIRRLEKAGKFPKRMKLSDQLVGWTQTQIQDWLANLSQEVPTERSQK